MGGGSRVNDRVKNLVYHLIFVSKANIPNLRLLGPPPHVEMFQRGEGETPNPKHDRVKNFVYHLIFVSKVYRT